MSATEKPMPSARPASLTVWMTASVAVFVLLGSLALVLVFESHREREQRRAFEELARVNAGFLERTHLPQSAKMAGQLGEIIGAKVFFWQADSRELIGAGRETPDAAVLRAAFDGRTHVMPSGELMVGLPGRDGMKVIFLRPASARGLAVINGDTWLALGAFWALSLGLGCWLARRVTQPLRSLVESLPMVGEERALPELPVSRRDEIGLLAQTLRQTHESLLEERERRRTAERHALLGRMATGLAHEVRNPVAAIRLHAQLLEHAEAEEGAVSRRMIESEAERIEGMVGQWLSYAKPAPPTLSEVDLWESLRDAVRIMEPQARHAGVEIRIGENSAPQVISADRHRLQQVFGNLLRNAVQAMPSGGRVDVSVVDEGGRVAVVVEDQGSGFSESALARLGEPFYSEKEGGMGLGLAVAKEICEAHGGGLSAENRSSGGARVRVGFLKSSSINSSKP